MLSHIPTYSDVLDVTKQALVNNQKLDVITTVWDEVYTFSFPKRWNGGKFRKPQPNWFSKQQWLRYSVKCDGLFCGPCSFFGEEDPKRNILVRSAFADWCNFTKVINKHEQSDYHLQPCETAENFVAIMRGEKKDIACSMSSKYNAVVERNRKILAKRDPILKQHLNEGNPRTKYTSPMVQNELIFVDERNDDSVWDALYDKAVSLAANVDFEPSLPRNRGRQRNRPNAPAVTATQFWKANMYLPFDDHLLSDLEARLLQANDRFNAQYLLPTEIRKANLTDQRVRDIFSALEGDLEMTGDEFVRECSRWRTRWTTNEVHTEESLADSLRMVSQTLYPGIRKCLCILLVMPVSTATAERSFSTMRRVKTYLRSTMGTERLSGLGLMNLYREREINAEEVVDIFARRKDRRLALIFKV